jgi:ribosome recycling factor
MQSKYNSLMAEKRTLQLNFDQERNTSKLNASELAGLRERNRSLEDDVKRLYDRAEELEKRISMRNSADFKAATEARASMKKMEDDLQKTTDKYIAEINSIYDAKEKEIMD